LFAAYSASGQDVWHSEAEHEGDAIIISAVGARCGKCFTANGRWSAIANTHIVWPDLERVDLKFLWYQLNNERFWIRSGSAQPFVAVRKTFEKEVPLPPLPEQRRIVAEIEAQFTKLDAGVAALQRVRANLKRYRAAVLKAACEGKLVLTEAELQRRPGTRNSELETGEALLRRILAERREQAKVAAASRRSAGEGKRRDAASTFKYKEPVAPDTSSLPLLPEGWAWASMRQVGEVQLGRQRAPQHHTGDNMRPYLRVANVFEAFIDTSDVKTMNFTPVEFERYRLRRGDILLNEGQTPELVGRPAMFRDEVDDCCYQKTLLRFRAYKGLLPEFALTVFRSYMHNRRFTRAASITTNIAHLTAEKFVEIEFPLPPLAEQTRIVAEVERRLSVIDELETLVATNLARATRLRQAVLRFAFSRQGHVL
jgi:type I restriction enzyme S subunit